jgi:hypothetical protein
VESGICLKFGFIYLSIFVNELVVSLSTTKSSDWLDFRQPNSVYRLQALVEPRQERGGEIFASVGVFTN